MSRPIGLIEAGWLLYAEAIVPKTASAVQIQETRRAFYSGAMHLFAVYFEVGGDAISEDQGVMVLERISDELQQFGRDVGTDRERGRR